MNRDLRKIMNQIVIDRPIKFSRLPAEERSSILRIYRYIGDILGYDSIRVESQNSDIEFKDKEDYFLEVKTLFYFRGKFLKITKLQFRLTGKEKRRMCCG